MVARFHQRIEAEMLVELLRANGIIARLQWETAGDLFGLTLNPMGDVMLFVAKEQAAEALNLIEAFHRSQVDCEEEQP